MSKAIITPMEDFCGKEIMENEIVRRHFISAMLRIPVEKIKSTRVLNPFLRFSFVGNKNGILDVLIELWDGRKINIEIQVAKIKYWDKRSIFYLAKLYAQGLRIGKGYDKLKPCINISILDFDYLQTPEYHTVFRLRDQNGNDYSDVLEIHILELQKLKEEKDQFIKEHEVPDEYDRAVKEWVMFFKCRSEEDVEMLKSQTSNIGIKEAIRELMSINLQDYVRTRFEMRQKALRDQSAREDYVKDEGRVEGRAEGHSSGVIETKREDILDILGEYGEVSEKLREWIMKESDPDRLTSFLKLAVKAGSIEEFERQVTFP